MKKYIFGLLTGIVLMGITGVVAYQMNATQITYEPKDSNWNVKTVKAAIDDIKANGVTKKSAKVISGDVHTVGSIVKIGDEEFYVIGQGTGDASGLTKLFAKYNLKDNNQVLSGAAETSFSETNYWNNKVGTNLQYAGSYNGNPYPYVYDSNSNLYNIINTYVNKIERIGIDGVYGRLMSYEEANALSTDIRKSVGHNFYWLGSVYDNSVGWRVDEVGGIDHRRYSTAYGVRPVILVPTSQIG